MQETKPKVLFVDDEPNIRIMLGLILQRNGFDVTAVGTVPEALRLISQQEFDVLIADLNVGSPGDGFTVVSAMRRTRPRAVTFILTGYPAFDTALEAIRLQVDDYVTKPTDADSLIEKIRSKLSGKPPERYLKTKRLTELLQENLQNITSDWLRATSSDSELGAIAITDEERTDHVPRVIREALAVARGSTLSGESTDAARAHGVTRKKQGFTVPLLIREGRILCDTIARCLQANLLAVEISYLISDMIAVQQTVQIQTEHSVAAFLAGG